MNPTYSLIIPHFNIPNLLERLLNTVPKREDLQVIVVDDCSTKFQTEFNNLRSSFAWVEWYSTGTNGGGGKARNIGLDYAKGKYILFADADDFFTPGLSMILNKYKNIDYDMLVFNAISLDCNTYEICNRATHLDYWIKLYKKNKEKGENKIKYVFGEPWCRLIRAQLIRDNNIRFQEVICHNDTKFTYMVGFYTGKLMVDQIVGYVVTYRNNSVIHTKFKDRDKITIDVFAQKQSFFLENHIKEPIADLYKPIVHDIRRFNIKQFKSKYNYLRLTYPELPIKVSVIRQLFTSLFNKFVKQEY